MTLPSSRPPLLSEDRLPDLSTEGDRPDPMQDYYQLRDQLLLATLILTVLVFGAVWLSYSLNIALNYLLGAIAGIAYLKLLAKEVEQMGNAGKRMGRSGLILFAGLIFLATQWQQLHILPVFLGFLTYKVTLFLYTAWSVLKSLTA